MATTKIWAIKVSVAAAVTYVSNENKTVLKRNMQNGQIINLDEKGNERQYSKKELDGMKDILDYADDVGKALSYAANDVKVERDEQRFVSGVNCLPETARTEFDIVKQQFDKTDKVLAHHAVQSFKPGEVTPEVAHEIGVKLAEKLWGDDFQVLVATHLDQDHIHNHFVINSVSYRDGHKYNGCKKTYQELRKVSDQLCKEHGLSIVETKGRGKSYYRVMKERLAKAAIDSAIEQSTNMSEFSEALNAMGFEVTMKIGIKHWTIKADEWKYALRMDRLGDIYTNEALMQRIKNPVKSEEAMAVTITAASRFRYERTGQSRFGHRVNRVKAPRTRMERLYHMYCFKLGVHKKRNQVANTKEAMREINRMSADVKWMESHPLGSDSELKETLAGLEHAIEELVTKRKLCYRILKLNPEDAKTQGELPELNKQIKELRQEKAIVSRIRERSETLDERSYERDET